MNGKRLLVSVLAALVAVICVSSAFPYFDPRVPFRFERFTGPFWIIGVGPLDIEGANKAFLKYFPIGTPTREVEAYFQKVGGRCFTLPRDRPGELTCNYGHLKFPWFCIAQVWNATMTFDPATNIITGVKVSPWVDAC
jgi:hypothetical protein